MSNGENPACGLCVIGIIVSAVFIVVCGIGAHERITFTEPAWIEAEVQNCGCVKFEERQRASVAVWYSPVCVLRVDKDNSTAATCSATGDKYGSTGECEQDVPTDAIIRVRQDRARPDVCYTGAPGFKIEQAWFVASCVLGPGLWPSVIVISLVCEAVIQVLRKLKPEDRGPEDRAQARGATPTRV
jgi:hypothetical protein